MYAFVVLEVEYTNVSSYVYVMSFLLFLVDAILLLFLRLVVGWVGVKTEVNAKLSPQLS